MKLVASVVLFIVFAASCAASAPVVEDGVATPTLLSAAHLAVIEAKVAAQHGETEAIYRGQLITPSAALAHASADVKFPLIVFLHGAGERGDDNKIQLQHFPHLCMSDAFQAKHPCFVLAMQCHKDELWSPIDLAGIRERNEMPKFSAEPMRSMRAVMQAIDEVLATQRVDRARIYLTGLSMGGFGSFDLAARKPELFAAVAPICGGGDPKTAEIVAAIPFFIVHGDDDPIVPVALSRAMNEAIATASAELARKNRPKPDPNHPMPMPKRQPNPMYREYTKVGHASWTPAFTFGDNGILDWMFAQQKAVAPAVSQTK